MRSVRWCSIVNKNNTHRILIKKGTVCNNLVFKPMVRLASVADSTYEPYREDSKKLTISFGKTVYGGIYDWNSGILTGSDGVETQLDAKVISALPNINTLFTLTGETTVTGRADPVAIIEKLTNAILALGGNV